jgi:3-isopropylmalate/(R)-2-methylmalate dehydratase small subunit
MDYGFEAIIASSYGDIFKNNSSKQGLVIVELPEVAVSELMELVKTDPNLEITVDVADMTVEIAEKNWRQPFTLDPITRERLLNGWDDIGISLLRETDIAAFEENYRAGSLRGVFDGDGRVVHSNE